MSPEIKNKIIRIVNVAETSVPEGDYTKVTIANDGPKNIRQISYGRSQLTEFNGSLGALIKKYVEFYKGSYANEFRPYIGRIGKGSTLANDPRFIVLLKSAGNDPLMRQAQDEIFEFQYWRVAFNYSIEWKLNYPLSVLVLYDTIIHSGPSIESPKSIVPFLRKQFKEPLPSNGGDEKRWISAYVLARHKWLETNTKKPILRKTIYRTQCLLDNIATNNWYLEKPVIMNGVTII